MYIALSAGLHSAAVSAVYASPRGEFLRVPLRWLFARRAFSVFSLYQYTPNAAVLPPDPHAYQSVPLPLSFRTVSSLSFLFSAVMNQDWEPVRIRPKTTSKKTDVSAAVRSGATVVTEKKRMSFGRPFSCLLGLRLVFASCFSACLTTRVCLRFVLSTGCSN